MNKLLLNGHTVFMFENGRLKPLGVATDMCNIRGHIFQVGSEIYALRGEELGFVAEGFGHKIVRSSETFDIRIRQMSEYRTKVEPDGQLWDAYQKMKAQDTPEVFDHLVNCGIAITNSSGLRLFFSDSGFVPDEEIVNLSFNMLKTFLYKGGIYAWDRDIWLTHLDFKPIYQGKNYLIFAGGRSFLFALQKEEDDVKLVKLGMIEKVIETKVSRLLVVEQEGFDEYAIYHLGDDLKFIQKFDGIYNAQVDRKSGRINLSFQGSEAAHQEMYVFKKGVYERLSV